MRAFDNFWDAGGSHADLQEHFADAWAAVAEHLGDHPAVIGYDVLNEPFPGSMFDFVEAATRESAPDGGDSRRFDEQVLGPFTQRIIDRIREVDPDHWISFEPRGGAPANGSPCWIPRLEDPRAGGPRLVYAPHLYSVALEANYAYAGEDATIAEWERQRIEDAARLATPVVIGEWGLPYGADDAPRFFREVVDVAERDFYGWAYWSYDPSGPDGWGLWDRESGGDNPAADVVVRPYPRRVPGEPVRTSFDAATGRFEVDYDADPAVPPPLEVFLPPRLYVRGPTVEVRGASIGEWTATWDAERSILTVAVPGAEGSVTVTARP